eukprot:RCo029663
MAKAYLDSAVLKIIVFLAVVGMVVLLFFRENAARFPHRHEPRAELPVLTCTTMRSCRSSTILRLDAALKHCMASPCTQEECCVPAPTCATVTCPKNHLLRSSPSSTTCRRAACTTEECCVPGDEYPNVWEGICKEVLVGCDLGLATRCWA